MHRLRLLPVATVELAEGLVFELPAPESKSHCNSLCIVDAIVVVIDVSILSFSQTCTGQAFSQRQGLPFS